MSILHRISGACCSCSCRSCSTCSSRACARRSPFAHFQGIVGNPLVKLILLGLIWAYMHHFCAGIRHLFMDMHMAMDKDPSRQSAIVLVVSLVADRCWPASNCSECSKWLKIISARTASSSAPTTA